MATVLTETVSPPKLTEIKKVTVTLTGIEAALITSILGNTVGLNENIQDLYNAFDNNFPIKTYQPANNLPTFKLPGNFVEQLREEANRQGYKI